MKKILSFLFLFSFISLTSYAQTGPGGVGNSSNNVIWLDGNVLNYSSGTSVSAWPDQSGNGNDFSQSTSSRQPTRVTYYGFEGVRFDGGDWLRKSAIAGLNSNTNTQYIVYNGFRANHVGVLFDAGFSQSNQFIRTYRSNGNLKSWVLNATGGVVQNTTTNSSSFQILSSIWNGGAQTFDTYKDGTNVGSQVGANGNPTGNFKNTIAAANNNAYRFNGDMGEFIMFNTVLNSAQRNIVDNYLSSKFKVTIANDMYAYDAGLSHQYELIGVGQEADGNNLVAQGKGIIEMTAAGLSNGEYIFLGHNDEGLSLITNDVPAFLAGGSRSRRTWRAGVTGTPGNVDMVVDVSSLPFSTGIYYLLVESNNGVFNDGGVTSYGPFNDVGGFVTFSGVALADGDYIALATTPGLTIESVKTGYWDVASTWNCSCVPTQDDDVLIRSGHTVTARTTTNIQDVTVDGTLNTQPTDSFNVKGNYTISATGNATHKTVTFNGTTAQQDMTNSSSNTINFSTLKINNSNNVVIQGGNFSVTNSVNVSSGIFNNAGGTFTFLSDASSTAIITGVNGGFLGEFVMQRFLSQRNANWADFTSPVKNNHLRDWDSNPAGTATELYMSKVNGIDGNAGQFYSVQEYDALSQSLANVTDTSYVLMPGHGIELWLEDTNGTLYNKTFDSRGTPNYGAVNVPVQNGWNLVGNPYQCWVQWTLLTKPTLNSTYYVWNTNNGSFDAKTGGIIPPHQGFWVQSTGAGLLRFEESDKNGSGSSTIWRTNGNDIDLSTEPYAFDQFILKISNPDLELAHELKLRLNNLASVERDSYDAIFKPSRLIEAPSITSFSTNSNDELAINSFNYENEVTLPIKIKAGVTGSFILSAINVDAIKNYYSSAVLIDHNTKKHYDLYQNQDITLSIDAAEDLERFSLRLSNNTNNNELEANESDNISIYKTNELTVINISTDNTAEIVIYNSIGQEVFKQISTGGQIHIPNSKIPKGINIVTVNTGTEKMNKKLKY